MSLINENILYQFLNKYSYKFPKGYPDLSDREDILILEQIFEKLDINLKESNNAVALEAINILKEKYNLEDDNFVFQSGKTFKLLIPKSFKFSRQQLLNDIIELPDFEYEGEGSSSLGRIKYKNEITIYIKPLEIQGGLSHGKENEQIIIDKINEAIIENKGSIKIIFHGKNKNITYENVSVCVDSSKSGATGYDKSDLRLLNSSNDIIANISIKKDGGFRWESSKKRYGMVFDAFIKKALKNEIQNLNFEPDPQLKGKYIMLNPNNNKPYSKVIINDFPHDEVENIIFGSENPRPIIVGKTFNNSDFKFNEGLLTITCTSIYTDFDEIEKANLLPIMLFARHSGKAYGVDFRAFPENLAKGYGGKANVLELDYKDIMG